MNKDRILIAAILVATVLLTINCRPSSPEATPTTSPIAVSSVNSSPIARPKTPITGPKFSIDEPLRAGMTEVSGSGPVEVDIWIADVTMTGEVIGAGQIDADGRFRVPVDPPLVLNHRIGIMVDAHAYDNAQAWVDELQAFSSESAITLPRIGRVYAATNVKP
jgi:hypothetical protein